MAFLTFNTIQNLTTCEPTTISWAYFGDTAADIPPSFDIVIAGHGEDQSVDNVEETIADVSKNTTSLSWSQVNVPPGLYTIQAVADGSTTTSMDIPSNTFQVIGGEDLSCVSASGTQTSSSTDSDSTGTVLQYCLFGGYATVATSLDELHSSPLSHSRVRSPVNQCLIGPVTKNTATMRSLSVEIHSKEFGDKALYACID